MAGELRSLEELLTNQIGLDPASVGSQLILRGREAADEGSETRRPGRLRAIRSSSQPLSSRS